MERLALSPLSLIPRLLISCINFGELLLIFVSFSHQFGRQLALWHRESDEIHNK